VKYATADFHKEMIHCLEKSKTETLGVVAFRGSGKSTIVTTAYPIWAILGKQQKKFCIILCQTKAQAKQHMMNLRTELENNEMLKRDLGPFQEDSDEWGAYSLVFKKHGARITVASTEQSIRGIRHNEHRPDLIVCDDVEDVQSTRTREGRDKTYGWLFGEVVPVGNKNTRLVVVGNLLHQDSLLMRIKENIAKGKTKGVFKEYPLLDENGDCIWHGKYPTEDDIKTEKEKVVNENFWQREFLLRIIPEDAQVIHREWIHYYDDVPSQLNLKQTGRTTLQEYRFSFLGIDLAVSQKDSADYTAIVTAEVYGWYENMRIYIKPWPVNKRILFPEQVEVVKELLATLKRSHKNGVVVETVGYQQAYAHALKDQHIKNVFGVVPRDDKRSRLAFISHHIKRGNILFPHQGCEELIDQIVDFGVEKHDDLADALSLVVLKILEYTQNDQPFVFA
jgi:predicted phage terminase large subunit-like protein